jgi:hypothetical protein
MSPEQTPRARLPSQHQRSAGRVQAQPVVGRDDFVVDVGLPFAEEGTYGLGARALPLRRAKRARSPT